MLVTAYTPRTKTLLVYLYVLSSEAAAVAELTWSLVDSATSEVDDSKREVRVVRVTISSRVFFLFFGP